MSSPSMIADQPCADRMWSQTPREEDTPPEWSDALDEFEEWEAGEEPPPTRPRAEPSPRRWKITFAVIAILLTAFSLIAFWGLVGSDWFYGTYGQINQAQWDRMADLRDRLSELDVAPEAINALSDALLLPHPATENVLLDLRKAALALEPFTNDDAIHKIQVELYELINEIEPDSEPITTPRPRPTLAPPPTMTPMTNTLAFQSADDPDALAP